MTDTPATFPTADLLLIVGFLTFFISFLWHWKQTSAALKATPHAATRKEYAKALATRMGSLRGPFILEVAAILLLLIHAIITKLLPALSS